MKRNQSHTPSPIFVFWRRSSERLTISLRLCIQWYQSFMVDFQSSSIVVCHISNIKRWLLRRFTLSFKLIIRSSKLPSPPKLRNFRKIWLLKIRSLSENSNLRRLLTVFVRQHLEENLKPIFSILDKIQRVSESSIPKQAENRKRLQGNEASASKGKYKNVDYDDEEEEEDETDKLKRKARDAELHENLRVAKEAEKKEKATLEVEDKLKTQKTLFPLWTFERILNEAIKNPNCYWLDPVTSFELENSLDSQLDLPITLKAIQFCSLDKIVNAPIPDYDDDQFQIFSRACEFKIGIYYRRSALPQTTRSDFSITYTAEGSTTIRAYHCTFKMNVGLLHQCG
ncbi:unnamed protein product [Lactuca saligna]|uniref:Uncharacterized protein n=1 Tax=Lactuca saligna TaxID=75948 RepID=A0AA36E1H8_LACSI|nr:unnamed protein product [Lactuca saligna]